MSGQAEVWQGRLRHVRERPFRHVFEYRMRMLLLDLDYLSEALPPSGPYRLDRPGVLAFHRRDHLGGGPDPATDARDRVQAELGFRPAGTVWLLAQPRFLGVGFNPVSFILCTEQPGAGPGEALSAILLEVRNTPWNERHVYVLDCRGRPRPQHFELDKDFHVSPFLPMDMRYRFRFDVQADRLRIGKENHDAAGRVFAAFMDLERQPARAGGWLTEVLATPPTTVKTLAAIYWQALRLWLRGARFHPHPRGRDGQEPLDGREHH